MDSIIFDLDGTLWDSRKTVAKVWTDVVREVHAILYYFIPGIIGRFIKKRWLKYNLMFGEMLFK